MYYVLYIPNRGDTEIAVILFPDMMIFTLYAIAFMLFKEH